MKVALFSKEGKKKKEIVLNPEIFGARVNKRLLELVQKAFSANKRHGTADTKTRKEVSGGGKKPWKQKGTGRARHSSIRSPIWRGGGTVFGPHPRSYFVNLPKTMRQQALISALSLKGEQKNILILEDTKVESGKTRDWANVMKSLPLDGKRALCVVKAYPEALKRASRNLQNWVKILEASSFNAYDVLRREKLLIEEEAIAEIENRFSISNQTAGEAEDGAETKEKAPVKAVKKAPKKKAKEEKK